MFDGVAWGPLVDVLTRQPRIGARLQGFVNRVRHDLGQAPLDMTDHIRMDAPTSDMLVAFFTFLDRRGDMIDPLLVVMRGHFATKQKIAGAIDAAIEQRLSSGTVALPPAVAAAAPPRPWPPCYEDRVVLRKAFINRRSFRAQLYDFLQASAHESPLLLVASEAGSVGKSHSWWLVQHVANYYSIETVRLDLTEYNSMHRLAEDVADGLGLSEFQVRFTTEVREATAFVAWLSGRLVRLDSSRTLLVFDHLDKEIPSDVQQLVFTLMKRSMEGTLKNVQVLVLDAPDSGFDRVAGRYQEEHVDHVSPADIDDCVQWIRDVRAAAGRPSAPPVGLTTARATAIFPLTKTALADIERQLTTWYVTP